MSISQAIHGVLLFIITLVVICLFGCAEEEVRSTPKTPFEIGKSIELTYDSSKENSFRDTYYEMEVAFYIPPGIEEFKNRPLMFTLASGRNSSVTGNMLPIIQKYGMIAVSPLEGDLSQFSAFLGSMIESEYIDPSEVYVSGFSSGGKDIYELAWTDQDKIKGAIIFDPTEIFSGIPPDNSMFSICILCQTNRLIRYERFLTQLNGVGVRTKVIELEGQGHFDIPSSENDSEKFECYDFVNGK